MNELDIFTAAVAIPDAAARDAFLDRECAGDAALRDRLRKLVDAHARSNPALDPPAGTAAFGDDNPTIDPSATGSHHPAVGEAGAVVAGRYKLLQQIGEGGMGTVWMAEQTEPVKRRVAVKLVRADRGRSQTILARFSAERQAIALMDHPHIAKLLDAGTTDAGSPYFVMELVKGVQLNDYCDAHWLSIPDRLALFMQVCGAVQHAHQKGIIHRDIKPSNVLVESHDGKPVPKVIDFGLAKATTGMPLTENTLFTAFGSVMGTPLYMAPEQASFNAVDIDTRADVYALGVILYELLTGTTPLTRDSIKKAALDEMLRLIREQEAPTPSSRLSSGDATPTVAANRQTEPLKLGRLVKGELDWIVLKALSKDRDRRYESATGFAKDIERFLNHEPVQAGPVTAAYRVRKFVRRNRGRVVAAGLVLAALVAGVVGTTAGFVWANAERERAVRAELSARDQAAAARDARDEAERQREAAEANARKALAVVNEYFTLVSETRLLEVPGLQPLRKELLESAVRFYERAAGERPNDPAALADLAVTTLRLAEVNHAIDRNEEAVGLIGRATTHVDRLLREHPTAADSHVRLAGFWKGWRRSVHWTQVPADAAAAFRSLSGLTGTWAKLGDRYPAAVGFRSDEAAMHFHAGEMFAGMGRRADAVPRFQRAAAILERLVRDHPAVIDYQADLGRARLHVGFASARERPAEAEAVARTGFEQLDRLAAERPDVTRHKTDLAWGLVALSEALSVAKPREAERHCRRAIDFLLLLDRELPGGELYRQWLGVAVATMLKVRSPAATAAAEEKDLRSLVEVQKLAVAASPGLRWPRQDLAELSGRFGAFLSARTGRAGEAEEFHRASMELFEKLAAEFPVEPFYTDRRGHQHHSLGGLQQRRGAAADAEASFRRAISAFETTHQTGNAKAASLRRFWLAESQSSLGKLLTEQKRYADAEPHLLAGYEGMVAHENAIPPRSRTRIPEALDRLIELYTATGRPAEAAKWRAERAKYPREVAPLPRLVK